MESRSEKRASGSFADRRKKKELDKKGLIQEIYPQIGQLKVDLDWLKKIWPFPIRRSLCSIDKENIEISLSHRAELIEIS